MKLLFVIVTVFLGEVCFAENSCTELGPVESIGIVDIGQSLVITWVPPPGLGECPSPQFHVVVENDGTIEQVFTQYPFAILPYGFIVCVTARVTITILVDDDRISTANAVYYTDINSVQNLHVFEEANVIFATWDVPLDSARCELEYNVEVGVGDEILYRFTTKDTAIAVQEHLGKCSEVQMNVISVNIPTEQQGTPVGGSVNRGSGPVTRLTAWLQSDNVQVSFASPVDSDACDLYYNVLSVNEACFQKIVTVEAIDSNTGIKSLAHTTLHGSIPAVNDFHVNYLDNILNVSWSPPNGGESCDLTYGILIRNNTQLVLTTASFTVEDCIPSCFEATVAVWPIFLQTLTGPMTWGVYERGPGPVTDLVTSQEDVTITVTWNPPRESEACRLTYHVLYTIGSYTGDALVDQPFALITNYNCESYSIRVTPITERQMEGPPTQVDNETPCGSSIEEHQRFDEN